MKNNKRRIEFLIDNISRAAQVIFTVLVIGSFILGFDVYLFLAGCVAFAMLLIFGLSLSSRLEG